MKRLSMSLAFGLALALGLAACGKSAGPRGGAAPAGGNVSFTRLIAHTDDMIKILRDNRQDPDHALQELTAYQEKHQAELMKLKQEVGDYMQKDPMRAAAASSVYGLKSAELDSLATEMKSKSQAR